MQDWMYRYAGCCEVTIELSDTFQPPTTELGDYWDANRESMFAYLEAVHCGVRGVIRDATTGAPVFARVLVSGNAQPVFSDPDVGDYYRLLLPGEYTLTFQARGYQSVTVRSVIVQEGTATRLDVGLEPVSDGDSGEEEVGVCPMERVLKEDTLTLTGLRAFRDRVLAQNAWGKALIRAYYAAAPRLNRIIDDMPTARRLLKCFAVPSGRLALFMAT